MFEIDFTPGPTNVPIFGDLVREGRQIVAGLESVTSLTFAESAIKARVYEEISRPIR